LQDRDWTEYWRAMFKKVTVKDIEHFAKVYRHSDEERNDLKQAYVDAQGIVHTLVCSDAQRMGGTRQAGVGSSPAWWTWDIQGIWISSWRV
jgi:hypothetical protein